MDLAVLVFVVLLLAAVGWWLLKAVLFFVKLAVLAVLVAMAVRAYLWVRSRARHRSEPGHR